METSLMLALAVPALAALAVRRQFLTAGGAAAAAAIGVAIAVMNAALFTLLLVFFVTSSLLTRLRAELKRSLGLRDVAGRGAVQVVCAGAPALAFAALHALTGDSRLLCAAVTAVAAVTADTWASEVGIAYGGTPRFILAPGRRVRPGVSGGVTLVGSVASAAGALTIALLAHAMGVDAPAWKVALFGYVGELVDSLLGAALQTGYICNGELASGTATSCVRRGALTNESVNLLSGLAAGALSAAV
jgi:uncharacterized protein (TIGR00297 family)